MAAADVAALAYAGLYAKEGTRIDGWDNIVALHSEALTAVYPKSEGPGVMFGVSPNGRRRLEDIAPDGHSTGLAVDIDEGLPSIEPTLALHRALKARDITHIVQWRYAAEESTYKVHLLLPYSQRYPVLDPHHVLDVQRDITRKLLEGVAKADYSTAKSAGVVFCMTRRPGNPHAPTQIVHTGANALDLVAMSPPSQMATRRRRRLATKEDSNAECDAIRRELEVHTWIESKGAWDVTCPVGHGDDYTSKTHLYPNGRISCMAGKCFGKPLAWFISHLDPEAQDRINAAASATLKIELRQNTAPSVTLDVARDQIRAALAATRPVEGTATVVQVSTGAGKTHAVAQYLDAYAAPFEGESDSSGLSAVLAVPTNALLYEVEGRLKVPHQRQVGVLAVLNDDGTPACRKHDAAKALQNSGGNVHRLMCGHCEYRDGCAAREGTSIGTGSLVVTNHALMTTAASVFHDRGRHPLLVWDESPRWVQQATIEHRDIDWLVEEFKQEAKPSRPLWEQVMDVSLYPDRYRAAVRPVVEFVRVFRKQPKGRIVIDDAIREWAKLPYHHAMLARGLMVCGKKVTADPAADFRTLMEDSHRLNRSEAGFDGMRPEMQQRVLRGERVFAGIATMLGPRAVAFNFETHVKVAALTDDALLYRERGGIVLDATANLQELKALRPDANVVTLRVQDHGDTQRYLVHAVGLSRTALKKRPDTIDDAVTHAKGAVTRWARSPSGPDRAPKTVVFCYRSEVSRVKAQWPEAEVAYYGNTRGYDRYFQEGFDAFVTIGDPMANIGVLAMQWTVLHEREPDDEDTEFRAYVKATAAAEAAQAHGRARSPQRKKGDGGRLHLHYGTIAPAGWDLENTMVEPLTLPEP
jgi:hypothetical protein